MGLFGQKILSFFLCPRRSTRRAIMLRVNKFAPFLLRHAVGMSSSLQFGPSWLPMQRTIPGQVIVHEPEL